MIPVPFQAGEVRSIGELMVFGGSAGGDLTKRVCEYLKIAPGKANLQGFPDGESFVKLDSDVRGRDCFVIQPTCPPVNDNLMQLLIFIDCLRRASASRITTVVPYFGYARQDRKAAGRTPITAKLLANLITAAGASRVLAMDLHAEQIQGFFDIPVDHLTAVPVVAKHFRDMGLNNAVIVSPDVGHLKTANRFANILGGEIAVIDKRRQTGDVVEMATIIGTVKDRTVFLFDDMISTGGTLAAAAELVRRHGAREVYAGATHAVFAGACVQNLRKAKLAGICVTDTIPLPPAVAQQLPELKLLSVAPLMGEAIRRIHRHESVSSLFQV
jgi:ribose-phosphate pyrophosphokinase